MIDYHIIEQQRKINYYVFSVEEENPYKYIVGVFYDMNIAINFINHYLKKNNNYPLLLVAFNKIPTLDDMIYNINEPIVIKEYTTLLYKIKKILKKI